jgi:hypothetical protein
VEVGAVGLGTLVAVLATTATADVTGVLFASLMATLGLFLIPIKKRQAKQEMRAKIGAMREQLVSSLRGQFEGEIERSLGNIHEAMGPYTRFVRAEQGKLTEAKEGLEKIKGGLGRLRLEVEEVA